MYYFVSHGSFNVLVIPFSLVDFVDLVGLISFVSLVTLASIVSIISLAIARGLGVC